MLACRLGTPSRCFAFDRKWQFATDTFEPNDVDCVLLIGTGFPRDVVAESEILAGLPFLELSLVDQEDFDVLVQRVFATDRNLAAKGMLEVMG